MYTIESYLTYVAAAAAISVLLFAASLVFILLDTGIRRLTFAARQAARYASRFVAGRALLPAFRRATHLLTGPRVIRPLQHAFQLVGARSTMRSLPIRGAPEHTR